MSPLATEVQHAGASSFAGLPGVVIVRSVVCPRGVRDATSLQGSVDAGLRGQEAGAFFTDDERLFIALRKVPAIPSMNGDDSILPEYCKKRILILGCGNRLFGDDGFGPAVIDHLCSHYEIPDDVYVMDVGTGVRKLLFTLALSERLPEQILIIDAVDKGRVPGELFEISLDEIPLQKADDFSLHLAPTSNLAKELRERGVNVRVLACQTKQAGPEIAVGLSPALRLAVERMGEHVAQSYHFTAKAKESPS